MGVGMRASFRPRLDTVASNLVESSDFLLDCSRREAAVFRHLWIWDVMSGWTLLSVISYIIVVRC